MLSDNILRQHREYCTSRCKTARRCKTPRARLPPRCILKPGNAVLMSQLSCQIGSRDEKTPDNWSILRTRPESILIL